MIENNERSGKIENAERGWLSTFLSVSLLNNLASVLQFVFDPNKPCKMTIGGKSPPSVVASILS